MKRILILLAATIALCSTLAARPVGQQMAQQVAKQVLAAHGVAVQGELHDLAADLQLVHLHLFTTGDENFVLVADDDAVRPVWGYSVEHRFRTDAVPQHIRAWLSDYEREIKYAIEAGYSQAEAWQQALQGQPQLPAKGGVEPLIATQWNQAPYYNSLCPADAAAGAAYGNCAVSGCVAIATAQVMRYHEWPDKGYGSHSYYGGSYGILSANFGQTAYDWDNMPAALTSASSDAEVEAVATLVYHVGVGVEMQYSAEGSGAQNYDVLGNLYPSSQTALQSYFKYSPTMYALGRSDRTLSEWNSLLKAELDEERPILYQGTSLGAGHSFVVDGYDASDNFHINWGWGGYCDGYFAMGNLEPLSGGIGGGDYMFNYNNVALFGVKPNEQWGKDGNVSTTATEGGTVSGAGKYLFGDTVSVYAAAQKGYRFLHWDDGADYNPRVFVMNGGDVSFKAIFEKLGGDTIGYCTHGENISALSSGSYDTYWGIRLPSSAFASGTELQGVQFFANGGTLYTVDVLTAAASSDKPTTLLASGQLYVSDEEVYAWHTIKLQEAVSVPEGQDIWLRMHASGVYYAASFVSNCGGEYSLLWGEDMHFAEYKEYSFMVRALTKVEEVPIYHIGVHTESSLMGTVSGGGDYPAGATVVLTATPAEGYHFSHWNTGDTDNPLTITVVATANYIAFFEEDDKEGLSDAEQQSLRIYPNPTASTLTIEAAGHQGELLLLSDQQGRLLMEQSVGQTALQIDLSAYPQGIYYLRLGEAAVKVVKQ